MKKLILPILLGFVLIAILGIAGSLSAQSNAKPYLFTVASVNVVSDSAYITTETQKVNVAITYKGESTTVVAKRTIFICPIVGVNSGTVTQIDCFRLADGRVITEKLLNIDQKIAARLDSVVKNRK